MITRAVSSEQFRQDKTVTELVFQSFKEVPVANNELLKAIMEVQHTWNTSPVVWVDDFPYKIKLVERTPRCALLCQMCLDFTMRNNGKKVYRVANKRMVKVVFA